MEPDGPQDRDMTLLYATVPVCPPMSHRPYLAMVQQTGRLMNSFDFCQLIKDVYYAQLTKESVAFL